MHSFTQARANFARVLSIEPNDYQALYYLGLSEWRLGEITATHKDLSRAVDVLLCHHIDFPAVACALAQVEHESGRADAVLGHATLAVTMAERNNGAEQDREQIATALLWRGKIESALGRRSESRPIGVGLLVVPNLAQGWFELSRSYRQRGETKLAAEALATFQRIHNEL